jgi:hypothetical protein
MADQVKTFGHGSCSQVKDVREGSARLSHNLRQGKSPPQDSGANRRKAAIHQKTRRPSKNPPPIKKPAPAAHQKTRRPSKNPPPIKKPAAHQKTRRAVRAAG